MAVRRSFPRRLVLVVVGAAVALLLLLLWGRLERSNLAERLEKQRMVAIDNYQALRELAIRTAVERGFLPPQAIDMVDQIDGTVSPDFFGGAGDNDTLRWDLDRDGRREEVTEREVYDESFADIQESDPREGVYSLTMSFPDRLIRFFAQEIEGEWRRVEKLGKQWVAVD